MADDWFNIEQLHRAAADGDVERVHELLSASYDPNVFDDLDWTPLHYAVEQEHLDVMRALIDAGANVNAHNEERIGNTVLREFADRCSYEVAKCLVEAGADPTIPGWMAITALDQARGRKKPEGVRVYELLLEQAKRLRNYEI